MHFKLIVAFVDNAKTGTVMDAARDSGATGATVVGDARGEGLTPHKTFLGLTVEMSRDMVLFLVEEHLSRQILEKISEAAEFDSKPGSGVAFQLDVEDVVGLDRQIQTLISGVEDKL